MEILSWLVDIQGVTQRAVTGQIAAFASSGDWLQLGGVLPIAVVFGMAHALTPGHNKLVLATYVAGQRLSLTKGLTTSALLSATHIGSAVVVAFSANWLISRTITEAGRAPVLETFSRAALLLFGTWMVWRAVRPGSHGHTHGGALAIAAGLVPCPLTLFVVVFAAAQGAPAAGILFALAMFIGVGVVLCGVGAASAVASEMLSDALRRIGWLPRLIEGSAGMLLLVIAANQLL